MKCCKILHLVGISALLQNQGQIIMAKPVFGIYGNGFAEMGFGGIQIVMAKPV